MYKTCPSLRIHLLQYLDPLIIGCYMKNIFDLLSSLKIVVMFLAMIITCYFYSWNVPQRLCNGLFLINFASLPLENNNVPSVIPQVGLGQYFGR